MHFNFVLLGSDRTRWWPRCCREYSIKPSEFLSQSAFASWPKSHSSRQDFLGFKAGVQSSAWKTEHTTFSWAGCPCGYIIFAGPFRVGNGIWGRSSARKAALSRSSDPCALIFFVHHTLARDWLSRIAHLIKMVRKNEGARKEWGLIGLLRQFGGESFNQVDWICQDVANVWREMETTISLEPD